RLGRCRLVIHLSYVLWFSGQVFTDGNFSDHNLLNDQGFDDYLSDSGGWFPIQMEKAMQSWGKLADNNVAKRVKRLAQTTSTSSTQLTTTETTTMKTTT
ncbi:hypothetical protein SK128_016318, partial [Halocaridina rubra]